MILAEYLATVFVGLPPAGGWPREFFIVTAYNPNRILSEADNISADSGLRSQLAQEGIACFRITGCSPNLVHREPSWGLTGIPLERAIEIGLQHGQNAVFEVLNDETFVVSCHTLERRSLGQFQDRIKDLLSDTIPAPKPLMPPEEISAARTRASMHPKPIARIRRNPPEPSNTKLHRSTSKPLPETPRKNSRLEQKKPPTTLEALREQLNPLKLRDRIVLVGEFYRSHSSMLDALSANQMAELIGVEFFSDPEKGPKWRYHAEGRGMMDWYHHKASLTLKSRGHKIVLVTNYNDAEDSRSFTIG